MGFNKPQEIAEMSINAGVQKAKLPLSIMLILGFLGGAFISLGFLLDIRVIGNLPVEWGSLSSFLGAAVFPLGLILIVIAGGELITGNIMTVAMAFFSKKVTIKELLNNWFWITLANLIGALFVAYFFGHVVGLTETGPFMDKTIAIAQAKVNDSFFQTIISAIGCNWLVCLAIWIAFAANDVVGKIFGIWFPIMAFVAIGFQHVVANMFVIPAAIFANALSWGDFIQNIIPTFIGNVIGGAVFVGLAYFVSYSKPKLKTQKLKKVS
ncbi:MULTISPECIES: formate/nitrite transporter family protein [Bacillus]|uniref:formate/nitrite transporter family protein n=1 Tax=Bacillus TaxID=1386 RepID=UPI0002E6B454|nr:MULTISPECIES: formate/nitrite transporter family protein [Bacillus]